MHASTASISSKKTIMGDALDRARASTNPGTNSRGDKSHAIRDVILGMLAKAEDRRTILIAPGIARRIIDEANFPTQRRITADRLYDIKRSIEDGTWNPNHVLHFVLLDDGTLWLVNGQTRLTAIAECGGPLRVGIVIQRVPDEHAARVVYTQFDKQAGVRTTQQLLSAAGVAEEHGLPRQLVTFMFSAVGFINNNMSVPTGSQSHEQAVAARNTANKIAWIGQWVAEAKAYYADLADCLPVYRRALLRGGTMAVALLTYRYQPGKAHDFWRGVAEGVNLRKNDPRLTLGQDIINRNNAVGMKNISVQQAALAWNAFFQGRDLKIIKCTEDWRLVIAGTPVKGGR